MRRLVLFDADLLQHRYDLADDERQRDEQRRQYHRRQAKMTWMPLTSEPAPEPAGAPVDEHQREPDDDR